MKRAVPLSRFSPVTIAVATVSTLAAVDTAAGPGLVLIGLLAVGPCLAAVEGRPRAVLAVGAYTLVLITLLSWWPDRLWGTLSQLLFLVATCCVTGVSYFVARRVRALEAAARLADSRMRMLAAVVEQSDDAITGITLDGVLTAWNTGAERMFGHTADDMIGGPPVAVRSPTGGDSDEEALRADRMRRIKAGERGIRFEVQAIHKDGSVVDVGISLSPIFDDAGVVVGASCVARDLTSAKRAAADQRATEERLQHSQRMASLGQLAGGVAHDFNNLLSVIINFTAFAAEQAGDEESVRADLAQVTLAAERAVGLTRQLLTFSHEDIPRLEVLDINASIAEATAMLARTIGEHIELISLLSPVPLMTYADAGHIQQILMNLAVNARDAMPNGGTLLIEATEAELDERQADVQPVPAGGRYIRLRVSDTGTGMSPQTTARIFDPFFTTKPTGQGTGLGLATVYGIVAGAGGSINVYSEIDIGTTFRVYFPIAEAPDGPARTHPAATSAPAGRGQTVLVVEDEPALRESIVRILDGAGYRVLSAAGGPAALALSYEHHYDLVITDVIMPDMSGKHLAELLHQRHPDLPVLYMSGYTNGLLATTSILDPDIAFIEKPFTAKRLLTEVDTAISTASTDRRRVRPDPSEPSEPP